MDDVSMYIYKSILNILCHCICSTLYWVYNSLCVYMRQSDRIVRNGKLFFPPSFFKIALPELVQRCSKVAQWTQ